MALYSSLLFFHIVSVLGLFISLSLEVATGFRLRAAKTTAQVQEWMTINRVVEKIMPVSVLLILASGLFMLFTTWGWNHAWIDLSLGLLIVLGILGIVINGSRMKAIEKAVAEAPDGEVSASLQRCLFDPLLQVYTLVPGCIALGIVALMVLKLDWIGSGVVVVIALIAGIIGGTAIVKNSSQYNVSNRSEFTSGR